MLHEHLDPPRPGRELDPSVAHAEAVHGCKGRGFRAPVAFEQGVEGAEGEALLAQPCTEPEAFQVSGDQPTRGELARVDAKCGARYLQVRWLANPNVPEHEQPGRGVDDDEAQRGDAEGGSSAAQPLADGGTALRVQKRAGGDQRNDHEQSCPERDSRAHGARTARR